MSERRTALALLCVQAVLLFSALGLLPMWTDEWFTMQWVPQPPGAIVEAVAHDNHPPLYFFLAHAWPWHSLEGLRAFSALWALAATAIFAWFWRARWALALFALSPCLLLYGRMARSYSMAVAMVVIAMGLLERWKARPESRVLAAGTCAALGATLYTHYVPGGAMLAAFTLAAWRPLGWKRTVAALAVVGLAFAPWVGYMGHTVRQWAAPNTVSSQYALSGSQVLEQGVKLGYAAVSFAIGESFLGVSLLLVPVVLVLGALGLKKAAFPVLPVGVAALIGYIGVARLLSYPFMPARLMWLLPFLCLAVAAGIERVGRPWVAVLLLVSYGTSIGLYFRKENFLNLGYVAPLPEIVDTLNREGGPYDLILLDPYNTDFQVIRAELAAPARSIVLYPPGVEEARRRIPDAPAVFLVRNTRDASPGHTTSTMEAEACANRSRQQSFYDPYAPWQQLILRRAGLPLTHFYELTVCR
jgi:hypothetical protein